MATAIKWLARTFIVFSAFAVINNLIFMSNLSVAASIGFPPTFWTVLLGIIAIAGSIFELATGIVASRTRKNGLFHRMVGMAAIAAIYEVIFCIANGAGFFEIFIGIGIPISLIILGRKMAMTA